MWLHPFLSLGCFRKRYGERFTVQATTHPPLVFLSDPDEIWSASIAPESLLRPGEGGGTVCPIVGSHSFMLSDGRDHLEGRRAVAAAFSARAVEHHADMVREVTHRALASWPLDRPLALHPALRALTLEVILRTLTGRLHGPLDAELRLLHARVLEMLAITGSLVFVESRLRHGPGARRWQRFLRARAEVDKLLYALIDRYPDANTSPSDVLGRLMLLGNPDGSPPSPQQVRDNVMSLILAGHETTASQLAWAFQLLAHHPGTQRRLAQEIDRGDSERYLTATIQEVLRHRCVFVFSIPRAVAAHLEIGGWAYEPPTQLLPCIHLLHHDPTIYPHPEAFRPERFLDTPPSPRTWLPWGGGRKRCPGLHLAQLEMKIVLSSALQRMTVEPSARRLERPRWRSVIVTPHRGSRVVLRNRRPRGPS